MQVLVRTLEGKTLAFKVEHSETIADFVARVTSEVAPAALANSLALAHRGKKLADTSTFETLQLKDRAVLLLLRSPTPTITTTTTTSNSCSTASNCGTANTAAASVLPALSVTSARSSYLAAALSTTPAPITSLTSIALSSGFTSVESLTRDATSATTMNETNRLCPMPTTPTCSEQATTRSDSSPSSPSSSPPSSPIQTDLSRCWKCSKKLGFKGTRCRCGFLFCEKHRYNMGPFSHECTYDYKTEAQIKLRKLNPKIDSIKVDNKIV